MDVGQNCGERRPVTTVTGGPLILKESVYYDLSSTLNLRKRTPSPSVTQKREVRN